jgi:hypothetical protein
VEIYHVSPHAVNLGGYVPLPRDVRMQKARLESEGQIEPIQLLANGQPDLDEWCYAREQVVAARELGWTTILVTY